MPRLAASPTPRGARDTFFMHCWKTQLVLVEFSSEVGAERKTVYLPVCSCFVCITCKFILFFDVCITHIFNMNLTVSKYKDL